MFNMEKNLGLLNQEEVDEMSNFQISEEIVMEPTAINWKTAGKLALAAGGAATVWLPCSAPAAAAAA